MESIQHCATVQSAAAACLSTSSALKRPSPFVLPKLRLCAHAPSWSPASTSYGNHGVHSLSLKLSLNSPVTGPSPSLPVSCQHPARLPVRPEASHVKELMFQSPWSCSVGVWHCKYSNGIEVAVICRKVQGATQRCIREKSDGN